MRGIDYRGFTLLELLIGFAIASLIMTSAYTVFFTFKRSQADASRRMEKQRMLRSSLDLIRREFSSIRYRKDEKQLRFLVEDRDFYGNSASSFSFSTIAPPQDGAVSDQLLVKYSVAEDEKGYLILNRKARDLFTAKDSSVEYPLFEQHEGLLVECFDGKDWRKSWDTDITPSLPLIIRVTISIRDSGRLVPHRIAVKPRIQSE